MSLLEKASIITTPTAYGVGVLNSIKPAIPFGEELISNGSFNNGSTGWTIINGTVTDKYNASMTAYQSGIRITPFSYTGTFKVVFDLVITSGNCKFDAGSGNDEIYTTSGTKEKIITNPTKFEFNAFNLGWVGSLDNVSVKEMIDADFDFTRTSSATRINPDYLLETVSINSDELVQNGNFSELGSQLIVNGNFADNSAWSLSGANLSISNGQGISTGSNFGAQFKQTILQTNKIYKLTFDIVNYTSGSIGLTANYYGEAAQYNTEGTHTTYFTSLSQTEFRLYSQDFVGSIDNVSVKQVDPNDNWTLGTGWSIGDGVANAVAGSATKLTQTNTLNGKKCKVTLTVSNYGGSGLVLVDFGSTTSSSITSNGTYTLYGTYDQNDFQIFKTADFSGSITNISVIEIQENGVPRLDYTNGTASILIENASTNLLPYSEDFSNSAWSKLNASVVSNNSISPDGTLNANKIIDDSTNGVHRIQDGVVTNSTGNYTYSIFLKKGTLTTAYFQVFNSSTASTANVDLENGTITSGGVGFNQKIEDYGNDWYRCSISFTSTNTATTVYLYTKQSAAYVGTGEYLYAWGAQLEEGSYPTSYILTSGTAVTRAAETLNNAGNSDLFNDNAGTLYCEIAALTETDSRRDISISNGTANNSVRISFHSVTNTIRAQIRAGNVLVVSLAYVVTDTKDFHKVAFSYGSVRARLFIDGVQVNLDTSVTLPTGLNTLDFNAGGDSGPFYGKCKTVAVFKEALSESEMACLTSTGNREIFLNYYYRMHYVGANIDALSCAEKTFNV